jgi:hypothetical protein
MAEKAGRRTWVMVNRAPMLTLWAAAVAVVLGFEHDEALTLGRAVAGLNVFGATEIEARPNIASITLRLPLDVASIRKD